MKTICCELKRIQYFNGIAENLWIFVFEKHNPFLFLNIFPCWISEKYLVKNEFLMTLRISNYQNKKNWVESKRIRRIFYTLRKRTKESKIWKKSKKEENRRNRIRKKIKKVIQNTQKNKIVIHNILKSTQNSTEKPL